MKNVKVDVIIPVYKPDKKFEILLKRLQEQECRPNRIIVMNTEEKYWMKEWEKCPFLEVHHLEKKDFDHGGTRKKAATLSDADIMVFMTQDALPADKSLIANLIQPFSENENIGASYARQLPLPDCSYLERYTRSFNYPEKSVVKTSADMEKYGIKTFFCSNVCAAYDKQIYEKTGGFPERAIFNEDMICAGNMIKAGYAVSYTGQARVYHSHNYTGMQQFHRNFDLGVSQAENPEIFDGVPSEKEGIRLVKRSIAYLIRTGHIWLIPRLIWQSGTKYAGYLLGKRFRKLPRRVVLACTMNKEYWNRN